MEPIRPDKRLVKKWLKILSGSLLAIVLSFLLIDRIFPFNPPLDFSQVITSNDGTILHVFLNKEDKWRVKTGLDEISPELRKSIVFKEDRFFYYHFGINPIALVRALVQNTVSGERISGASTITMQLARLLDPRPRSYKSKLIEMFRAVQLEWHFSKKEIIRMYLNHLPYGGNIEGVKTASLIYYEQSPQALSLAQIVTLSIIPNNPSVYLSGKNEGDLLRERNRWLDFFLRKGIFSGQVIRDAKEEEVGLERHPLPRRIPHLATRLHADYPEKDLLQTFIDLELQTRIETITWNHIRSIRVKGIQNASVMVVDNETGGVISYLGSADFNDAESFGQVDGIRAIRSPGSTLKPFLYALAIDKGLITPATILTDVPARFGGYHPENYDGTYRGMISAKNALALSLNVPAVKLMNDLHEDYFIGKLVDAGFQTVGLKRKELGLSVILGGCGVTLEELTNLFCSFANKGILSPSRYFSTQERFSSDTLFSAPAAFLVTEMMTSLKRPDFPVKAEQIIDLPRIAWKTGTSYGRRDAWSVGYNPDYTVGVWIGNFQGNGIPELNGTDFAAPLLFKIFRLLDRDNSLSWFELPPGLRIRDVCARSGLPPSDFCTDLIEDAYIPGISPGERCQHLRAVFVNADSSLSFCRACLPEGGFLTKFYPNYPPEVIAYMNEENIPYEAIPAHNPRCERIFRENAPRITSLTENAEYILYREEHQRLKLACQPESDVGKIFWYVNNKFLSTALAQEALFFEPPEGEVKVSCVDDKGRNTDIWIVVKYI
ncbi:MAG TPA: penicillin-binding protein 1C [Bacteroidales bacterium]|nr:penicillin-binding protein 1C [Bacteroidales bacterium]